MNEQLHRSVLRLSQLHSRAVEDGAQERIDAETMFSQADSAHSHCMWQTMCVSFIALSTLLNTTAI